MLDYAQPFVVTDVETRDVINIAIPRAMLVRTAGDFEALHGLVLDRQSSALIGARRSAAGPSG